MSTLEESQSCNLVLIWYYGSEPRKLRALIADLEKAGFRNRGGKGSHQNFEHDKGLRVTLSGKPGDDALHYQEKEVRTKIQEASK